MESLNQDPGFDRAPLAVDIDQPGFFPYARFALSGGRKRPQRVLPLSPSAEFSVWPNVTPMPEGAAASRKKARDAR
jgi:hypothetical protein